MELGFDFAVYLLAGVIGSLSWLCFFKHPMPRVVQWIHDTFIAWFLLQQFFTRFSVDTSQLSSNQYAVIGAAGGMILFSLLWLLSRYRAWAVTGAVLPVLNYWIAGFAVIYFGYSDPSDDRYLPIYVAPALLIALLSWRFDNFRTLLDAATTSMLVIYGFYSLANGYEDPSTLFGNHWYLYVVWVSAFLSRLLLQGVALSCSKPLTPTEEQRPLVS